ncbi:MAG: DUF362 domain-containing protein [Deltaproteobacteria bacterium]|nr:DUF362 domain-containing protein [Deltaproteobacteria bacterium]
MNRRDFLKYQMRGALWLAAGGSGLFLPKRVFADTTPDITVAKGAPGPATRAAVDLLGGIKAFVKPGHRVVIKPNMSFASPPERASNTHPEVVRALAAMCKDAGAAGILILDHTLGSEEQCLENSGIKDACKSMTRTEVMKQVMKSDILIAAPVAKSHSSAGVSLSMKGMMGLIFNRRVMHWRYDLHTSIVDLSAVLKPDLVVIDATRVLSTNGPGGPGKVLHPKTVIASRDMVAADAYTVSRFEWYGKRFKPRQVRHIREAHQRGLGRMDIENLGIKSISL